jgi:hypothetical protein
VRERRERGDMLEAPDRGRMHLLAAISGEAPKLYVAAPITR